MLYIRKIVICFLFLAGLSACVSQTEHERVQQEKAQLEAQLEEERFGAGKLLQEGKDFMAADNIQQAEEKLNALLTKHGDKTEAIEARTLLAELDGKKKVLAENSAWNTALNSEDLSYTEQYLSDYPNGRYKSKAKARYAVLKAKKQDDDYQHALASNSSSTWKRFLEDYPNYPDKEAIRKRIIRAEVDEIMQGDHGRLPSFSSNYSYSSSGVSSVAITNQTSYTLTIRYSGPDVTRVDIAPGATRRVSLNSGQYRIAASVDAPNVRNYAGTESLTGDYTSSFYISSSYY